MIRMDCVPSSMHYAMLERLLVTRRSSHVPKLINISTLIYFDSKRGFDPTRACAILKIAHTAPPPSLAACAIWGIQKSFLSARELCTYFANRP